MSIRFSIKCFWALVALVLAMVAPLAQDRLIINVGKARSPQPSSSVIHYQGTGSVRHSEQRAYASAQNRHSIQVAESRSEGRSAAPRTTVSANSRQAGAATGRTTGQATDRHGSVRLDTIR
jgi:hypothetical protein